jgi:hypothetical protein
MFAEWQQAMDPQYAQQQLDKHLRQFGISITFDKSLDLLI